MSSIVSAAILRENAIDVFFVKITKVKMNYFTAERIPLILTFFKLFAIIIVSNCFTFFDHALTILVISILTTIYVWILDQDKNSTGDNVKAQSNENDEKIENSQDSFNWMNKAIQTIWLNYREYAEENLIKYLWPLVKNELMDIPFRNLWKDVILDTCYIGDQTPQIKKIESWSLNNDLFFSFELTFDSNAFFRIIFATKHLQFPMTLENIIVRKAKIRLVLKDWHWQIPFASGMHLAFVEAPDYDWDLKHLAGIADIDGFDELILDMLNNRLTKRVILPRMLIIPFSLHPKVLDFLSKYVPPDCLRKHANARYLMLEPLIILKLTVIQGKNFQIEKSCLQDCKNFISTNPAKKVNIKVMLGELFNQSQFNAEDEIWDFVSIFPVQHIYEQKVIIEVTDARGKEVGRVEEDLSRIANLHMINDWYSFENSEGQIKLYFESLPLTNERKTAILESRPYGVLSIFLQYLVSKDEPVRPVVHLDLEQNDQVETWTSLKPFMSKKIHYLNEGTMMLVHNVLDEQTKLTVKLWDSRKSQWIGEHSPIIVKNMLRRPAEKLRLRLDNVKLVLAMALYHL